MNMQQKNTVDALLAKSFKELILTIPLEKITIKDITDKSGVVRPTFYNHFQDKYELLEWIIREEILEPVRPLMENNMIDSALVLIFTNMQKDKEFFMKVSRTEGQNSFESIAKNCIKELLFHFIKKDSPSYEWLTKEIIVEYYAQSFCFAIMTWIKTGMPVTPAEFAEVYNYILKNSMEDIIADMQ